MAKKSHLHSSLSILRTCALTTKRKSFISGPSTKLARGPWSSTTYYLLGLCVPLHGGRRPDGKSYLAEKDPFINPTLCELRSVFLPIIRSRVQNGSSYLA
uniref:Uncharacterized protein n=1 Tax=Coccidioides posadasii RMSCC 3488 TaxID=454284 RepID=A0A0J6FG67_COCPO|nr:hypothetical protein CPAG_08410 [Coccidioides posadasii RMSCC 3488]